MSQVSNGVSERDGRIQESRCSLGLRRISDIFRIHLLRRLLSRAPNLSELVSQQVLLLHRDIGEGVILNWLIIAYLRRQISS